LGVGYPDLGEVFGAEVEWVDPGVALCVVSFPSFSSFVSTFNVRVLVVGGLQVHEQ
jgi:hypothetical protein